MALQDLPPISEIIVKKLSNTATSAELEQLENWGNQSKANRQWIKRFNDQDWVNSTIRLLQSLDENAVYEDFKRLLADYQAKKARSIRFKVSRFFARVWRKKPA